MVPVRPNPVRLFAIAVCGKVLAVLTALQQREEFPAMIHQHDVLTCVAEVD